MLETSSAEEQEEPAMCSVQEPVAAACTEAVQEPVPAEQEPVAAVPTDHLLLGPVPAAAVPMDLHLRQSSVQEPVAAGPVPAEQEHPFPDHPLDRQGQRTDQQDQQDRK